MHQRKHSCLSRNAHLHPSTSGERTAMERTRRPFLKTTAGVATAAGGSALGGFPYFFVKDAHAESTPWVKKDGKIRVDVLFSVTGSLAVVETDATPVVQFATDKINPMGGSRACRWSR